LIFHCEFSSERGPKLCKHLRQWDRREHECSYPELYYPELYILEGGYKKFYQHYPELCEPCGYVPMRDRRFVSEMLHSLRIGKKKEARCSIPTRSRSFTLDTPAPALLFDELELEPRLTQSGIEFSCTDCPSDAMDVLSASPKRGFMSTGNLRRSVSSAIFYDERKSNSAVLPRRAQDDADNFVSSAELSSLEFSSSDDSEDGLLDLETQRHRGGRKCFT